VAQDPLCLRQAGLVVGVQYSNWLSFDQSIAKPGFQVHTDGQVDRVAFAFAARP